VILEGPDAPRIAGQERIPPVLAWIDIHSYFASPSAKF
jgi:hypothetical protein